MVQSTKTFEGFSTCFRQWRADSHCKFLHGYGVSVKMVFEGRLDDRNWVVDFGGFGRSHHKIKNLTPKAWLKDLLDHTTIVAQDDPLLQEFKILHDLQLIQLRIIPATGCEKFAEYIYDKFNTWIQKEYNDRVSLVSVEFKEHEKNSAIYIG